MPNKKLERERRERERIAAIDKRIEEIDTELNSAYNNLERAKETLHNVTSFKFLRSQSERHEQVTEAESVVQSWQSAIDALENDRQKLAQER